MTASAEETTTLETELLEPVRFSLPRVNLLPPEIAEARRFRRVQMGLGGALVCALGAVVVVYLAAAGSVGSAQESLDRVNGEKTRLQAESAKYSEVTAVYQRAAAADAMLEQAMNGEISFSSLMMNLSMSTPDEVWIKSLGLTQTPTGAAGDPAAPAAGTPGATPAGGGTLTVTGMAYSHNDVAAWLDSVAAQEEYGDPELSNSTEALVGKRKVVNFVGTAPLNPPVKPGTTTPAGG